jgi:hypothetical protein
MNIRPVIIAVVILAMLLLMAALKSVSIDDDETVV